jgi:Na+/H+-dicarboxylate symporter
MATIALTLGFLLALLFGPGHGMNIDTSKLDTGALDTYAAQRPQAAGRSFGSFLLNIIPTTSIDAPARNDILQVLFFALIFGIGLALVGGEKDEKVACLIDAVATVLFKAMGIKKSVVGLVIPTGYSFNLDALLIYLTLAVVFIAQPTNTRLSIGDLLLVLGISLLTSKGANGLPGSAIVILAATLNAVPTIPAIGLVLVMSADWFIGMAAPPAI